MQLFQIFPVVRLSRLKAEEGAGLTDLLLVNISETGLSMLDPFQNSRCVQRYDVDKILTYGFRPECFLFIAGEIRVQKRWRLATYSGKAMNDLLMSYINLKVCFLHWKVAKFSTKSNTIRQHFQHFALKIMFWGYEPRTAKWLTSNDNWWWWWWFLSNLLRDNLWLDLVDKNSSRRKLRFVR